MVGKFPKLDQVKALRIARATRQSSRGGVEGHASSKSSLKRPDVGRVPTAIGVESDPREAKQSSDVARTPTPARKPKLPQSPSPQASAAASVIKSKRAPAGTFDRIAYQREYMRKRRQAEQRQKEKQ